LKKQTQAPYQKNETVTLTITGLGSSGEGIGRLPVPGEEERGGYTVFVKDAIVGDRVRASIMKAGKTYAFARLQEIVEPSPDRIAPRCPIARSCGGCQIQMMDYRAQLEYKKNKVREDLIRIGGFVPELIDAVLYPAVGMDGPGEEPWRYRNKEQVPVGCDREGRIAFGFYAGRTHAIVPMKDCLIGREGNALILDRVREWMEKNHVKPYDEASGKGIVRHVLIRDGRHSGQIMVCIVANADALPEEKELAGVLGEIPGVASVSLNTNKERTTVILGRKVRTLWGEDAIEDSLYVQKVSYPVEGEGPEGRKGPVFTGTDESVRFGISPLSFYQVNPVQTEHLYKKAIELAKLTGKETVLDAYCGIGTIGITASGSAKQVIGVELNRDAVKDAIVNAKLNGLKNCWFTAGDAGEYMQGMVREGIKPDVIFMDPPRSGSSEAFLRAVIKTAPSRVVYVSCDPETLARDLDVLTAGGCKVQRIQPVDMFPFTEHVETVVLLSKGEVDSKKIRVEFSLEDMDMSEFQDGATYTQIKDYVLEHSGLKVSNLYISQIKRKCGIEVGKNYNLPKSEDSRQPLCPPEKEKAIREAFKYFGII